MLFAIRALVPATLTAIILGLLQGSPAGAVTGSPTIRARPRSLMIGRSTTLRGRGFPASTEVELQECGVTSWLAPADPCLAQSAVRVTTDHKGRFDTTFQVGLCPEGEATQEPTQRVCYVGELATGLDTAGLTGAARILVSYP